MPDRNFLFVCSQNKWRSPTAEHVFADLDGVNTLSAGTNRDAEEPVSNDLIAWADVIFTMERQHRQKLERNYRKALHEKRIVVLGIPDNYRFMDPELVSLLREKMRRWLP